MDQNVNILYRSLFFQNHTGDLDNVPSSVSFWAIRIFTTCKRSLGQGNFSTSVCHSVQRGACVPCMPPCHTCPPLFMSPAMHTPLLHMTPLPCVPPAMRAPCHACPLPHQILRDAGSMHHTGMHSCSDLFQPASTINYKNERCFNSIFRHEPCSSDLAILCRLGL